MPLNNCLPVSSNRGRISYLFVQREFLLVSFLLRSYSVRRMLNFWLSKGVEVKVFARVINYRVRFTMEAERAIQAKTSKYDCLLFDLDDTLYPLSSGLQLACRKNIQDYMLNVLGIDEDKVSSMCVDLYKIHGTTMAGLKALGYEFDNDHFHSYVHGRLPYENLRPDPVLRSLLLSTPQRKIVFTNSDRLHATTTLNRLGLEDCFEGIICFETLNPSADTLQNGDICDIPGHGELDIPDNNGLPEAPMLNTPADTVQNGDVYDIPGNEEGDIPDNNESPPSKNRILCKPSIEAIKAALKIANTDPKRTLFFDDSTRNIAAGTSAGLHCVLVGSSVRTEAADFVLESIHNIKEAIPEIWDEEDTSETEVCANHGASIETLVTA